MTELQVLGVCLAVIAVRTYEHSPHAGFIFFAIALYALIAEEL